MSVMATCLAKINCPGGGMIKFPPGGWMPLSSVTILPDHIAFDSTDKNIRYFVDHTLDLAIERWRTEEF